MAKLDDMRARHLLNQLELTPEESRWLANGLGKGEGERFTRCEPFRLALRTVQVRGRKIAESESGWKRANGESICNLPIRVETVLTTESGDSHYRIAVQHSSRQSRFTIPEGSLKRDGLFGCVFRELKKTTGELLNFQRRWNKDALFIAMSLSPPKMIVGSERIGWQKEPLRFQFPHFSILNTGDVINEPVPLVIEEDELPASHLNPPGNIPWTDIAALLESTPGTQIVWALAACISHNLLAGNGLPAPNGIILDGEFAREASVTAARSLGCAEVDVNLRRGSTTILDTILDAASRHGWPAIVKFKQRPQHRITSQWLDSAELRNAMLPLDRYAALAVSSHEGFVRVWVPDAAQPLGQLRRATAWVIPNYLQSLCQRKKWIDELGGPKVIDVLHDMAGWFEGIAGSKASVIEAESALFIDRLQPATAFARLVSRMYHEGEITFARAGWDVEQPGVKPATIVCQDATDDKPAVIGVRPQDVNTVLGQRRAPAMNLHTVEKHLKDADAWVVSAVEQQGQVWLIDAGWWDENSTELDGTPDSFDCPCEGAPLLSPT